MMVNDDILVAGAEKVGYCCWFSEEEQSLFVPKNLFDEEVGMLLRRSCGLPLIDRVDHRQNRGIRQQEEFLRKTFRRVASSMTPMRKTQEVPIPSLHTCSLEWHPKGGGYRISVISSAEFAKAFVAELEAEYLGGDEESELDWEGQTQNTKGDFLCPRMFSALFPVVKRSLLRLLKSR